MSNKLQSKWSYSDIVNYAMQQNHVPVVKNIALTHSAEEELREVIVTLSAEPEFAYGWTKKIDVLPAGQTVDLGAIPLRLSTDYLGGLTERVSGLLTLTVQHNETVLLEERESVTVLAFDEWSGLAVLPEMAAAFVTPNHPQVLQLVREAADLLGKWSGSPTFSAYQSKDPNRVRLQAAAIYSVIQSKAITYCVAAPSFEQIGQRVRLPDTIFTHRMGNCFDLSLLYAACLEAVGLHPLLVFTEGHAFAGVWLVEETFSESVQDDISLLTKRIAQGINEICLVEATYMNEGQTARFDDAVVRASSHLHNPDQFDCIVDVRRARSGGIRPLPLRTEKSGVWEIEKEPADMDTAASVHTIPPEIVDVLEPPIEVDSIPMSRQRQWERRLLDLSLRNTLINFRLSKSSVQLMTTQLGELEDGLAEREEFQLLAKPADWQDDVRSVNLYQSIRNNHPLEQLLRDEFGRKRLRADLNEAELEKRMVHLYRSARLSLEENGANTLYLALGLLKWYESPASELPRYAPLVLIPVQIMKKLSRSGYTIRGRDEEPQMNITLLEMLRQDYGITIGGLDALPRDEKGIDLKQIFHVIRHAMMQIPRWDVEEAAYLGLFSFGQFVMWNDLRARAGELAENSIVASLMEGKLQWRQEDSSDDELPLDEQHPGEQLIPVSTDSSQLAAIRAAAAGQSFVLHGPPGTGKSQTITNMIANALAGGKRVLFVAEKMAALSVVQKRLEHIGLGAFCLELHSNKSTKRAVLDQLQAAIDAPRKQSPDEWNAQADRLAGLRGELNAYTEALHHKHPFGFTLFEAVAGYEQAGKGSEAVVFGKAAIEGLTAGKVTEWRDLAAQLKAASAQCGGPAGHAWADARGSAFTQSLKNDVEQALKGLSVQLSTADETMEEALSLMGLPSVPLTYEKAGVLARLCELMVSMPDVKAALLEAGSLADTVDQVKRAAEQGERRDAVRHSASLHFTAEAVRFDAQAALSEWTKAELKWFLPKFLGQNRIVKLLRTMAAPGAQISKEQAKRHLNQLIHWQEEEKKLQVMGDMMFRHLGASLWNDGNGDWSGMEAAAEWAIELHERLLAWHDGDAGEAQQARARIGSLMAGGRSAFLAQDGKLSRAAAHHRETTGCVEQLGRLLRLDEAGLAAAAGHSSWYGFMRQKASRWEASLHELRDWCAWRRVWEQAEEAGLAPLLLPHEDGRLPNVELVQAFERGLYKACANYIFDHDDRLGTFSGILFEEKLNRFRETDRRFEQLTRGEIAARLSAKVPQMTQEAAQSSEAGILQRAIRSGGRAMSIRRLFDLIPNLLPRLAPCMLMSPISVAQYLDPGSPKFDLVIFDEASQVPTAQAVGALARGHQAVIVGDPKQLPPTSFFSKTKEEADEENAVSQDMESILDDCLALGMYQRHLSWHYRSRHESLIAFSNAHYYDNKLMTFPSPDEPVSSVFWRPVDGFYDRGRTKHNRAEGEAVVAEIVRRLKDPALRQQSIGVVTFSSIQQTLIEDLLDEAIRREAELEQLLPELPEPIFVKNLENVQGDERDIILFSIGYGPDASGKVSLNFGPLNREGGWRRLNVAVSRARCEMIVFSTLRAHQLSASRTSAEGVLGLKAFLEYAEKGKQGLPASETSKQAAAATELHRSLADELRRRGYQVDLYVGASGYRIDAGIIDPDNPKQYRLGILLDGPMYNSAKTARDRDILRIQVLEQLGWRLHQVWLPDWWENREAELRKIETAMEQAKAAEGRLADPAAELSAQTDREQADRMQGDRADHSQTDNVQADQAQATQTQATQTQTTQTHAQADKSSDPAISSLASAAQIDAVPGETASALPEGAEWYKVCDLEVVPYHTDAFYQTGHTLLILDQMKNVIREEGPVSRTLLAKRVLQAWGIARMGARLDKRFDELFGKLDITQTDTDGTPFLWPEETAPSNWEGYRIAAHESQRRSAEDLPAEEVANAVKAVLSAQISLPEIDLVKQVNRLLGYARSGAALEKAARNGIACAIERGFAFRSEDERIVLKDR
ncbi:DUF3320 domain-containing protein [Paenibacillus harenae]|uniref:DUF3320 domain-containing protein n=1 Tax=Paenibacillus harenae TaxID=306543 RepID=UPI000411BC32|nr:DUF3320 domain-containing protein [Paenibacillus harenae]